MSDINILNPIEQQFIEITDPPWWAEISIPGTLKLSLKNQGHYFSYMFAVTSGAPVFLLGEAKISGGGNEWPFAFPVGWYLDNDEWISTSMTFTTPDDWTTKSIQIYFKADSHYAKPCIVSFKGFKMMVSTAAKPQYLPTMGIG